MKEVAKKIITYNNVVIKPPIIVLSFSGLIIICFGILFADLVNFTVTKTKEIYGNFEKSKGLGTNLWMP